MAELMPEGDDPVCICTGGATWPDCLYHSSQLGGWGEAHNRHCGIDEDSLEFDRRKED